MGSEMGNNNVSGIKEEEKAAVEVAEKAQETVPAEEVKGDNHVILGDQTKDFHAKGEELSSNVLSDINDLDAERHESNEKEIGGKESKHQSKSQESSPESNNSNGQESDIQKSDSPDEGNHVKPLESNLEENIFSSDILKSSPESNNSNSQESDVQKSDSLDEGNHVKPLESNLEENIFSSDIMKSSLESNKSYSQESDAQKSDSPDEGNHVKPLESNLEVNTFSSDIPQIHDQPSIGKETETKEVEGTDSTDSKTTTQPSKSSNYSTISPEDCQCLQSKQSEEVTNMCDTCNLEEKENENAQKDIEKEHLDYLVSEETHSIEDGLQEANTSTEMCDSSSTEKKLGDGLEDHSDGGQVPLRKDSSDFSDSSTEVVLQCSPLDPSVATPEPQEKHVIRAEQIDLISIKSEEGANKQESKEINPTEQTVNDLIIRNSAPSENMHDAYAKENGKEVVAQMTSSSGLEKVHLNGEVKVTHKRSKSVMAGNKRCDSIDQFEDIEEDIKMLPSITAVSTQLSSTDKHDAEKKPTGKTSLEETEKREDVSSSMAINNDNRGTSEESILGSESFKWEGSLLETSSASQLSSQNSNATPLGFEGAKGRENCATIDLQEYFVNAKSNLHEHKATMQTQASSGALESFKPEPEVNVQTSSGTSAENEVLSNRSNQQCPSGEMSHLPNGKVQESSARLSIESNPGHPGHPVNQVQRSKSPSFDFGLQLDAKSEDSDQTPLLHHDKAAARSFSGFANVRFQNRIIQTDYGRKSLDFEPVAAEEKTIRMERSDSDISRASFMNLLKKDEKVANAQFSPKKQESPAASNNSEDLSTDELALTSVKGSGKRKSRPSIFTSCICCTASVH